MRHSQTMRPARVLMLAGVVVLLLAGCGLRAPATSDPAGESVHPALQPATGPAPDVFQLVSLRPPLGQGNTKIAVKRVSTPPSGDFAWSVDRFDPASSRLLISWTDSPTVVCGRANLIQVQETRHTVVIGVQDTRARLPVACSDVGLGHVTGVQLQQPLGGRALVVPLQKADITGTTAAFRSTLMTTSGKLPKPGCDSTGVPVGMSDARTTLAPREASSVVVCRYAWRDGQTRISQVTITDPARAAELARQINRTTTDLKPAHAGSGCDDYERTHYALTFAGRDRLLVPVTTDASTCGQISNGASTARTPLALVDALDALFEKSTG